MPYLHLPQTLLSSCSRKRRVFGCASLLVLILLSSGIWFTRTSRQSVFPVVSGLDVIVYEYSGDPGTQLYVMYPDGSHQTRLTYLTYRSADWWFPSSWVPYYDAVINLDPQPAPNGQGVVFLSSVNKEYAFYQIHFDGSALTRLPTPNAVRGNSNAVLSPDGQQIVFIKFDRNDKSKASLTIIDTNGANEQCLTCNYQTPVSDLAWSSDGRSIVFVMHTPNGSDIYRINADGSNLVQLTNVLSTHNDQPSWSPDGRFIAFRSDRDRGQSEIYMMRADGSAQMRLTMSGREGNPAWSPDGRRIGFASARDGGETEIYVMNADGSMQKRLTHTSSGASHPAWVRIP